MSKALNNVMGYANEDTATIYKHWIIFIITAIRVVIMSGIFLFIASWLVGLRPVLFYIVLIYMIISFFRTVQEFNLASLGINNICMKGNTGHTSVNVPLEKIGSVSAHTSGLGKLFGYGTIEIVANNTSYVMTYMINTEAFQEAIVLLQEAKVESRNMRSDERHADSRREQAVIQAQLQSELQNKMIGEYTNAIANAILQLNQQNNGNNNPIDNTAEKLIEENNN